MVNDTSTKEQVETYLDALAAEKDGYVARIANAKNNRQERLDVEQLEDRVKQVDAEIKRAKSLTGEKAEPAAKGGRGKKKAAEADTGEATAETGGEATA